VPKKEYGSWLPSEYENADVSSLQALSRGEASPDQQKRALDWIIWKGCRTYEPEYRFGGKEAERDSCHAAGTRWVGLQIIKLLKLNLSQLKDK
jgi:hypothetical protein